MAAGTKFGRGRGVRIGTEADRVKHMTFDCGCETNPVIPISERHAVEHKIISFVTAGQQDVRHIGIYHGGRFAELIAHDKTTDKWHSSISSELRPTNFFEPEQVADVRLFGVDSGLPALHHEFIQHHAYIYTLMDARTFLGMYLNGKLLHLFRVHRHLFDGEYTVTVDLLYRGGSISWSPVTVVKTHTIKPYPHHLESLVFDILEPVEDFMEVTVGEVDKTIDDFMFTDSGAHSARKHEHLTPRQRITKILAELPSDAERDVHRNLVKDYLSVRNFLVSEADAARIMQTHFNLEPDVRQRVELIAFIAGLQE